MNLELLEHELSLLGGKPVIVCEPRHGRVNFSYAGLLNVIPNNDHTVGFHLITPMNQVAVIFYADDVLRLDPPGNAVVEKIIRLRGPHDYREHWQAST